MSTHPLHPLHPLPSLRAVAAEQLRAVWIANRQVGALIAGALTFITLSAFLHRLRGDAAGGFPFSPEMLTPAVLLALLAPLSVWRDEGPARRGYHWAMPVGRTRHSLLKVLAGWSWIMGVLGFLVIWGLGVALLTGGDVGIQREVAQLPGSTRFEILALPVPAWQWLVPFTGGTIAYLLGSAVALGSDRPWAWIFGSVAAFFAATTLLSAAEAYRLNDAVIAVVQGTYGLDAALTGTLSRTENFLTPEGRLHGAPVSRPVHQAWLGATLLWSGIGAAGVLFAARLRKDG